MWKPYKDKTVIQNLSQNRNIVLLNEDKEQEIGILDRTKYIEKCKAKLRILKSNKYLKEQDYKCTYSKPSRPGIFYRITRVHNSKENDTVNNLLLRLIISNVEKAACKTVKYFITLLSTLTSSEFNIRKARNLLTKHKNSKRLQNNLKSVFSNVPSDKTIKIILRTIYLERIMEIDIPLKDMEELLYLCTKHVHFSYGEKTHTGWWSSDEITIRFCLSKHIYNKVGNYYTTLVRKLFTKLEMFCRWYICVCFTRKNWIQIKSA